MKTIIALAIFSVSLAAQTLSDGSSLTITLNGSKPPIGVTYASKLATPNCNVMTGVKTGGGACTDSGTAALNTFLATASVANPVQLVIDGGYGITGLNLGTVGNVVIRCTEGSGVFVINASDSPAFYTGQKYQPSPGTPGSQGSNLEISGCLINGNRNSLLLSSSPNYPATNSTSSTDPHGQGGWLSGIHVSNMQNVLIQNNLCTDIPAYCTMFDNVTHGYFIGNRVLTKSFIYNQDGIHLNGPATDIEIRGNYYDMGDDAIALNAPEGYGGNITNVRVSNENWYNVWNGARLYSGIGAPANTNFLVDSVVFSNIVGHAQNAMVKLGGENPENTQMNQIGNVLFDNIDMTVDAQPIIVWESAKYLKLNGVKLTSSASALFDGGSTGSIGRLDIVSLNPGSITTLANSKYGYSGGSINDVFGTVVGPGVANTGFYFPDASIGNNTTYLSVGGGPCGAGSLCWRAGSASQQILALGASAGPVQKWLMNEGSSPFSDSAGNVNDLTFNGTFSTVSGIPGTAAAFNGSQWASAANSAQTNWDGTTPFTISFWVTRTTNNTGLSILGNQLTGSAGVAIGKQNSSLGDHVFAQLFGPSGDSSDSIQVEYTYAIPLSSAAVNVVLEYDGSKTAAGLKLYAGGILQSVQTVYNDSLTGSIFTTTPFYLGNNPVHGGAGLVGAMADVRIWKRLLTGSEITALNSGGAQ